MKLLIFRIFLIFQIIIFIQVFIFSQHVNEQKFRLAQSFEESGELQGALRLYSELIVDEPKSEVFFSGYVRTMKALSNYSDLLKVVRDRLPQKESLEMLDLYAELNWRTGNPDEANKTWDKILSKFPTAQAAYYTVSQTQINLRLFEKAISTLLKGRDKIGDNRLYSDPLVKLYIAIGDYKNGTKEILSFLNMDYNLPQAQGRLFALMINEDAKAYIGDELNRIASSDKDNIVYQEAYSWYLRTIDKKEEALDIVIRIDKLKNINGLEILNFANSLRSDGDYETAIKAYNKIIEFGKKNPYISSALFGLTRAMEDRINLSKSKIDKESAEEIVESYQKIIDNFPKTANSADSRLRLSQIYYNYFNDYSKAKSELEKLITEFGNSQYGVSAYLELGMIYLKNNELENSEKCFSKVNELYRFAAPDQKDKALYFKAMLLYFSGKLDAAKNSFSLLAMNTDSDISNDALNKLYLINNNEQFVAAVELFAKAELYEFQKNYKEAISKLNEVVKLAEKSQLEETALYKIAELEYNAGNYITCRTYLSKLSQKFPDAKNNDKYIMLIADSYYIEDNGGEALKFYTELITKFPESIYLHEARKKIRIIRKDKI